ncbi:hypothetical protein P3T76_010250 [Phytophthora citrophthora]|uniref:Uncharacterized protein n=1 Tax=Phytophthora citrophthora TaxID=4793 RepID=A0AAD9LGF7_9STRA|nr:hypothetical protein P3T76_010250 [Phytophthora citrophthora]
MPAEHSFDAEPSPETEPSTSTSPAGASTGTGEIHEMGDSEHSFDAEPSPETEPSTSTSPAGASTGTHGIHDKRAKAFRFTTVTDTLCKRRYLALAEAYGTEKLQKLRGSGTPAQNAQRERLLSQCQLLTDEDNRRRKAAKEADRRPPVAQLALEDAARLTENGDAEHIDGNSQLALEDAARLTENGVKLEEQRFEQQRQTADKQLEMMAAQTSVLLKLAEKLAGPGGLE